MYEGASFIDDVIMYGEPMEGESEGSPVVGNGSLLMRMDPMTVSSARVTTLNGSPSIQFSQLTGPFSPVSNRSLHLANGTWRTVCGGTSDQVVEVTALRQWPSTAIQTLKCREVGTYEHVIVMPSGAHVHRIDLSIKNVAGWTLHHAIVEATVGSEDVAYCCVYISETMVTEGIRYRDTSDATVNSVIRTTSANSVSYLLHTVVHGRGVKGLDAFEVASRPFFSSSPPVIVAANMKSIHFLRWRNLWKSSLSIDACFKATDEEKEDVKTLNMHIKTAMYRVFTVISDSMILHGDTHHDLFLDPMLKHALIPLAPWLAWSIPEPRPKLWMPVYAMAMSIIDAWSLYRVTLDRVRLESHYVTLRGYVEDLVTRVEMHGLNTSGRGDVGEVVTRDGDYVPRDAFTTGVVSRALMAAEQICHALRITADPSWVSLASSLHVETTSNLSLELTPEGDNTAHVMLLHPGLLPVYGDSTDLGKYSLLMMDNMAPVNEMAESDISVVDSLSAAGVMASFSDISNSHEDAVNVMDRAGLALVKHSNNIFDSMWGACAETTTQSASAFLASILYGFLRIRLQGNITRDGIHNVSVTLASGPSTAVLPQSWGVVKRRMSKGLTLQTDTYVQNSCEPGMTCSC